MTEHEHAIRIAVLEEQIRGVCEQQKSHNTATQARFDELDDKVDQLIAMMNRGRGAYAASMALAGVIGAALNAGAGTKDGALGIVWVDALAGSVRPMINYCFFAAYLLIKLCQFGMLMNPALPWQPHMTVTEAIAALWTPDDMGIFSAIIAFWFGSRALSKFRSQKVE